MFLHEAKIENLRSIRSMRWSLEQQKSAGWHVILGDNGSGKSTFLKAIALALVGASDAAGLRQPWDDWLTRGEEHGHVRLRISRDPLYDRFSSKGRVPSDSELLPVEIGFDRQNDAAVQLANEDTKPNPERYVWNGGSGWFSAAYGPFRRFSGGDASYSKIFYSMPRLARHLSLFDERIALTEALEWLQDLKFKNLENDAEGALLEKVKDFLNESHLLPSDVTLQDVTSRGVVFNDAFNVDVRVEELSDGFRSVLSMTFELIRQMANAFGIENLFADDNPTVILPSGVVLIDEVDAHLHPTWQSRIGRWFCEHFPNIQFIVSTHSPLICQSAENGSIFVLPRAGISREAAFLEGEDLKRLLYGNVLDAYGTDAFGRAAALTRSKASKEKSQRLTDLNAKELIEGLNESERSEQLELRRTLPSRSSDINQHLG